MFYLYIILPNQSQNINKFLYKLVYYLYLQTRNIENIKYLSISLQKQNKKTCTYLMFWVSEFYEHGVQVLNNYFFNKTKVVNHQHKVG